MSGRGRGRGRGRAPPTGARLLLQRSAQEAGLDTANLRSLQDITKPQLFPDFEWHSSGRQGHESVAPPPSGSASQAKRAKESMVYLINKSREITHRFQDSPFYVRPSQEIDVIRYNKRPRPLEADAHLFEYMRKSADPKYLPTELLPNKVPSSLLKARDMGDDGLPKRLTLEELAAEEQKKKAAGTGGEEGEEDGELSDNLEGNDEDDEDEIADYTQDYYASDDESDGGGGDEAVF